MPAWWLIALSLKRASMDMYLIATDVMLTLNSRSLEVPIYRPRYRHLPIITGKNLIAICYIAKSLFLCPCCPPPNPTLVFFAVLQQTTKF